MSWLKILVLLPKARKVLKEIVEALDAWDDNKTIGEFKKECSDVIAALKFFV